MISTSLDCRSEYIRVVSVVVSELKLSDIQMQIFLANLVVSPDNAALQDGPEALNRVRVNCANDVLANGVVDRLMREAMLQPDIAWVSIGAEKADAVRYGFADESFKGLSICVLDHASNDVSLALDCADYGSLAGIPTPALSALFVPMPILVAPANVGFISTMPPSFLMSSTIAVRILWHMSQAVLYEPKPI
jgi:hypothetical protein